jgi:microcystin-dependent protein
MTTKAQLQALSDSTFPTNGARGITASAQRLYNDQAIASMYLPAGSMLPWPGPASTIPAGWNLCNGTRFSQTDYSDLFNALGGNLSPYGVGATDFAIPTIAIGTSIVQMDATGSISEFKQGASGGETTHMLSQSELPNIQINLQGHGNVNGDDNGGAVGYVTGDHNILNVGSNQPHNNMPPFISMNWIIKLY